MSAETNVSPKRTVAVTERQGSGCVVNQQHAATRPGQQPSAVRQFLARRFVIGRYDNKARVADHIDQNFHPYGHDTPFPQLNSDGQVLVPAQCADQTREIAWLVVTVQGIRILAQQKPRLHPRMKTGCFVRSPLARLVHLTKNVDAPASFLLLLQFSRRFRAPYSASDDASKAGEFRVNARTRGGRIHSPRWPRSYRNIARVRARTSAGFP